MKKNIRSLLFYILFFIFYLAQSVSFATTPNLRGVAQEERSFNDGLLNASSAALYLPRQAVNGTLKGIEITAAYLSDPDFIEKVKDVLYLYERDLLWFPVVDIESGFRPSYGAGLHYEKLGWKGTFTGEAHDAHFWKLKLKGSYTHILGDFQWKTALSGLISKQDDFRYYGVGADPKKDSRNRFISLTDQDYGVFSEERKKIQWSSSIKSYQGWKFTYLGFYQRRGFEDTGRGDNPLRDVFDLTSVPGFTTGSPVENIYNEVAFEWDTRKQKRQLTPGARAETYIGLANGIDQDPSDFIRWGADIAAFLPTFHKNRLLVPRVRLDGVEDINSNPIPFTEYPRHHHFRGISTRKLIHLDEVALTTSLEYQWPISHLFKAHVFADYLLVGQALNDLDFKEPLWAAGGGFNLHLFEQEFGKLILAGGSEGFEASLKVGIPLEKNLRGDW